MDGGVAAEAAKELGAATPDQVDEIMGPYMDFMPPDESAMVVDQVKNALAVKE